MKHLKQYEKVIEQDYTIELKCWNKCTLEEEILETRLTSAKKVIAHIKDIKENKNNHKFAGCRIKFYITLNNIRINNLTDAKLIIDTDKYNL